MVHLVSIAVLFLAGFAAGRVHHISSLKAKLLKLEATLTADEKLVVAKVRMLDKKL